MVPVVSTVRVLHLPYNVGGNPLHLSRGERELGLDSQTLTYGEHKFGYKSDHSLNVCDGDKLGRLIKGSGAFLDVRNKYDVFNFNFGSSLIHFPNRGLTQFELPFYPKNKKLFAVYQGCDARQKFPTMKRTTIAACHNPACYSGQCNSGRLDELRRKGIEKMSEYTEHMWALNPDLLYFLPKEKSSFLPYAVSPPEPASNSNRSDLTLKILHAPTNRAAKGSDTVLAVLEKLKTKYGSRIELVIVENLPYEKALQAYSQADLIIDQILIGWYGAFAVECMFMKKPVMVRVAEEDLHFLPPKMAEQLRSSVINADPNTIEQNLISVIEQPEQLSLIANNAEAYAHQWHHPRQVAQVTKEFYERAL